MEFGRIPWGSERATNRTSAKSTRIADESCGHGRRRRSRTSPHPLRLEDVGPADRAEPSPLSIGRWLVTFKLCRSRSAIQIPVLQFGGRNALVCNRDASRIPRSLTGSKKPHGFQEASRVPRSLTATKNWSVGSTWLSEGLLFVQLGLEHGPDQLYISLQHATRVKR